MNTRGEEDGSMVEEMMGEKRKVGQGQSQTEKCQVKEQFLRGI